MSSEWSGVPPVSAPAGDLLGDARLLLVFDGWCGVCTRFAEWVRGRDGAGRVRLVPGQAPGVQAALGLTREDVEREAWAMARDGRRYAGAAAINRTLEELGGLWRWLALPYRLPGAHWCEDRGYRWFARNRGRFARWGVLPACERSDCSR